MSLDIGGYANEDDGRSYETGRVSMYSLQQSMYRMESLIAAMRQDIHYMREAQMQRAAEGQRQFNDHEMRIRAFEAKRYIEPKSITAVFGVVAPIAALGVAIIAIIVK